MRKLKEFALDVIMLAGAAVTVYGLWLAWHPLGFISAGAALIFGALSLGTRRIG